MNVNLVSILASVIDANGRPVPDLTQDAFELKEEGVPQKIERFEAQTNRPLDLALMVDSSMSTFKDLKFETEAAAHFIKQVVRPGGYAFGFRILGFGYTAFGIFGRCSEAAGRRGENQSGCRNRHV